MEELISWKQTSHSTKTCQTTLYDETKAQTKGYLVSEEQAYTLTRTG